ncbi:SDR family NAD(P)-dependent oxidoreductase [uncultured Amnibacterium sp.]|uniref:SDR family NAD(P)-dependent oxidoreductase n=1 Tax=uncultured Amnibacterium sp. TaxID=1631851 RepID=UPI0035C9D712
MTTSLVLGGATGIGAAAVRAFRARGDTVVLADRDADRGARLAAEDASGGIRFAAVDLLDPASPRRAVEAAEEAGDGVIDAVFYNAGVLEAHPLAEWPVAAWDRAVAVNLRGPFLTAQAAAAPLARAAHGRFLVTSSTGALRGHAGMPAYHATKAGLLGLIRALADEWGPTGVTANAVLPGWIDTEFNRGFWDHQSDPAEAMERLVAGIPLGRQGAPDDVVGAILFLTSPESAYITGQALVVDGGYTAV